MASTEDFHDIKELIPSRFGRLIAMARFSIPGAANYANIIMNGDDPEAVFCEPDQVQRFGRLALRFGAEIPEDKIRHYGL